MTAFTFRLAQPEDHDAVAEIWHASASLPTVGPAIMPQLAALRRRLDQEIATGWSITLAELDGEIVGFLAIKPAEAILDQLFVRPDRLGTGLGSALLAHAKSLMQGGFTLFTRSGNIRARRFYERAGLAHLRDDVHPTFGDAISYYRWN